MGTYSNGVLGGFSGKVGTVVGSLWRGKQVMRSVPTASKKAPSAAQLQQRAKFSFALRFLNPIKGLLSITFGDNTGSKTPFNNALSYHLKEAITVTDTGFELLYSKVLIGMGGLCGISNAMITHSNPTTLSLTWQNNSNEGLAYPNDSLIVIAYAPQLEAFEFFIECSFRELSLCELVFPEHFQGHTLQLWATFNNATKVLSATSTYLGAVVL